MELAGIVCPIVTPIEPTGSIAERSLRQLVDRVASNGCDGIMVAGTTGEFSYLSNAQWRTLIAVVGEQGQGRVTLVANVSHGSIDTVLSRIQWAKECGMDYVASVVPGYFPLTNQEILRFYDRICRSSSLPVVIYNIPQRTHVNTLSVLAELMKFDNVAGIKDSSGDLAGLEAVTVGGPASFKVLIGTDNIHDMKVVSKASGIVPGLANVFPAVYSRWLSAHLTGATADAERYGVMVEEFIQLYAHAQGSTGYIEVVRAALRATGLDPGDPVFPGLPISSALHTEVGNLVRTIMSRIGGESF